MPGVFPQFLKLVPANQSAQELPNVCSFQVLGVECCDVKGSIIWRMVPLQMPANTEDAANGASYGTGPNIGSMEVSDDRGTEYQMTNGSGAGRIERVGRYEFRPAPPDEATILKIRWEELLFEVNMTQK